MKQYWPGPLTWDELVTAVRGMPERISREDVGTVALIAGLLGVFGFPDDEDFSEETEQEEDQ